MLQNRAARSREDPANSMVNCTLSAFSNEDPVKTLCFMALWKLSNFALDDLRHLAMYTQHLAKYQQALCEIFSSRYFPVRYLDIPRDTQEVFITFQPTIVALRSLKLHPDYIIQVSFSTSLYEYAWNLSECLKISSNAYDW